MTPALIILAAGKGTRMKSDMPKVLHQVASAPMLVHAIRAGQSLDPARTVVVTGHGGDQVRDAAQTYDPEIRIAQQSEQLGTGHAVAQAAEALAGHTGDAIVLYGDTPFIQPETLQRMAAARAHHNVVVLGFQAADPGRYGRLVMDGDTLMRIVEFKDASDAERQINFCNSGVIAADCQTLFDLVAAVKNDNASAEYYLTDIIEIARARGLSATAVSCPEVETMGVNSRAELARAERIYQARARDEAFENGVTLVAPDTVVFAYDTIIGRDTVIEPNVVFGPGVTVESGAHIRAFSHLEGCHVSDGAVIGPYARLRPGAELAENTRIGNFVEIKNAQIGPGSKVNHLSYIGDATVGEDSNIGAGTVTCNYDGVMKHHTHIGSRVFVGSDTMLVAPVRLEDDSMTASGSVITQDVGAGDLAVARARQENKPGLARRLFASLRAKKEQMKKGIN